MRLTSLTSRRCTPEGNLYCAPFTGAHEVHTRSGLGEGYTSPGSLRRARPNKQLAAETRVQAEVGNRCGRDTG